MSCGIVQRLERWKGNSYMECNGYVLIYKPNHHMAFSNGCVYEHILKAEEKLGRKLIEGEVVHHIDSNRKNNDTDNLMIFDSAKSHAAYHRGIEAVKRGDVWHCEDNEKCKCPICGRKKFINAELCGDCHRRNQRKNIPSKEDLLNLLIKEEKTFVSVGNIYGVSDNAVRKWCVSYGIPKTSKEIKKLRTS